MRKTKNSYIAALAVAAACVTSVGVQAADRAKVVSVQPGNLTDALETIAKQYGINVIYTSSELRGLKTQGISGVLTSREAVEKLLQGTALKVNTDQATGAMMIVSKNGPPKSAAGTAISGEKLDAAQAAGGSGFALALAEADAAQASTEAGLSSETVKSAATKSDKSSSVETMIVEDTKIKPFSDASVDIPRTINDPQPYYVFDSKTIERSGAVNIEDFLKQRLTMNTSAQMSSQKTVSPGNDSYGNMSAINLRGVGVDKTLVLVNGRRRAAPTNSLYWVTGRLSSQTDLNGIPLAAIDRIEVLPSSASGIYGGSALGGVVNVILKRNYTGGEVRATYDNVWDVDAPTRTVSGTYGMGFNESKTQLTINAQWSDAKSLLLQDRREFIDRGVSTILANSPAFFFSNTSPFVGAAVNITSTGEYDPVAAVFTPDPGTLTLRNGTPLNSRSTYIRPGTSPSTPQATLYSDLLANAGAWNFDLPPSSQNPTGLLRQLSVTPTIKSFMVTVRHALTPALEITLDATHSANDSSQNFPSGFNGISVSASSPLNPFRSAVYLQFPDAVVLPFKIDSTTQGAVLGLSAKLPKNWQAQGDYSWSRNRNGRTSYSQDSTALRTAMIAGQFNPFVDALAYPLLELRRFVGGSKSRNTSIMKDLAARASGPLPSLPWGTPNLTVGLGHRIEQVPENMSDFILPFTVAESSVTKFYERKQVADSVYAETLIPLVKQAWLPLLYSLDLQLSGRGERYSVDAGTRSVATNLQTGALSYSGTTLNGQPFFTRASYTSTNTTIGLKYQPLSQLTLRASLSTAFLPPLPPELIKNPLIDPSPTTINDPRNNNAPTSVRTISGGNPDLKPQNAKSWNAGLIWEPASEALRGIRFNAEYYRIEQFDSIGAINAQTIVNNEIAFPGRVTRDANGRVVFVDASSLNLYKLDTAGWDFNLSHSLTTGVGSFTLVAGGSLVQHLKTQYSLLFPAYDAVDYPGENGAAKHKSSVTLAWDYRNWTAAWSTRYFSAYKQVGALGGPNAARTLAANPNAALLTFYTAAQGGDTIPSQMYHDLVLGYAFGKASGVKSWSGRWLADVSLQLGIRNMFNKQPPFDAYYDYYISPYGDARLRSYWLSARKNF